MRAAIAADPGDYAWSSFRANVQSLPNAVAVPHAQYLRLGSDEAKSCAAYRKLFREAVSADRLAEIRAYVQQQRVLGTPRFQREIQERGQVHIQSFELSRGGRCAGLMLAKR